MILRPSIITALFASILFLTTPAHAWIGENGASMTLNGQSGFTGITCTYDANGHCASMTLAWDKGTNSYYPYALYRLRSDNMGGGDGISYPGAQLACPVAGVGSITINPTITTMGSTGIYRYVMVVDAGVNPTTCAHLDGLSGHQYFLGEVDLQLNPP